MQNKSLLLSDSCQISENIHIMIPKVGDILENEKIYYSQITSILSTPFDYMVQLDDIGVDYESISEYELFLNIFEGLKTQDTSLIFKDLDLSKFKLAKNNDNNEVVLYDEENDIIIDKFIYMKICEAIMDIHLFEKNKKHAGNNAAKKFLIEIERKKQKRKAKEKYKPYLDGLVVALVNHGGFKYNFETVMDLSIYKLNMSLKSIKKYMDYEQIMMGYYFGNVDIDKINLNELNWLNP